MKQSLFSTEGVTKSNRVIHTPGSFARNNLIYVQEAGELESLIPHRCIREHMDSYLFLLILSGKGTVTQDDVKEEVKTGDCVILDGHGCYSHESSEEEPWRLMWVHFAGAQSDCLYTLFKETCGQVSFTPKNTEEYRKHLDELIALQQKKDSLSEIYSHIEISSLLADAVKEVSEHPNQEEKVNLNEIREKINTEYDQEKTEQKLCREYGVSLEYLEQEFSARFGISLSEYLLNRRFTAAKELLRFSVKPIEVIIDECGIKDASLFEHLFEENEKMTVAEYRKKWAQWLK